MSQVFEAYRGYGLVAGHYPFHVEKKGTQTHVTVPVGKTFHTYNVRVLYHPIPCMITSVGHTAFMLCMLCIRGFW